MPKTKEQFELIKNESKSKIVDAGLKLFIEKGLLATSVSEIASLAGISKGLMYHYYKSKEELYYELVSKAINSSIEYMHAVFNLEKSPKEKIKLISRKMVDNINRNHETAQFFVFMNRFLITEKTSKKARELIENAYIPLKLTEKIISEGQRLEQFKSGDSKSMATLYWSAIHGLCAHKLIQGDKFVVTDLELLEKLFLKE
jgi:AcrR family transcriptional regulator